ncbi:MAG: hypothetical protein ABSE69_10725, partial [Roseiarcus sp.]
MESLKSHQFRSLLCTLIVLAGLNFLALSSGHSKPAWDELFFLHRAACVSRAVFDASFDGVDLCFGQMSKSPLMALLLLPAGPINGIVGALSIAPVCLALATLSLLVVLGWQLSRIGVPLIAVVLSVVAAALSPALFEGHAPFLVDDLLSIVVLATLLLLPLEWKAPPKTQGEAALRGALWGTIATLGVLSKLTYFLFLGAIAVPVVLVAYRRTGWRILFTEIIAASPFGLIALFMLGR